MGREDIMPTRPFFVRHFPLLAAPIRAHNPLNER